MLMFLLLDAVIKSHRQGNPAVEQAGDGAELWQSRGNP